MAARRSSAPLSAVPDDNQSTNRPTGKGASRGAGRQRSVTPAGSAGSAAPSATPFPVSGPSAPPVEPPAGPPGAASAAPVRQELPVPAHALPQRSPRELLTMARRGLEEAAAMRPDGLRYATAHLAALRAAAAVLAARAVPSPGVRRSRPTSVWTLVVMVAPELRDWAAYFAAGATKRAAAEAGIPRVVTAREADNLMRSAEQFIAVVEVGLGFSYQPVLEGLAS